MSIKDKNKRILGIAIGLIGFALLFFLSYRSFTFNGYIYSFIGQISKELAQMTTRCYYCRDEAIWFWGVFGIIYFFLVWRYRACIGHWAIKIVTLGYKKI